MLPTYKSILVTTDLNPHSTNVFKHAVMLARHNDAEIHLLHVVQKLDPAARNYVANIMGSDNLESLERSHQQEALQKIRTELEGFARAELADHPEDLKRFCGVDIRIGHPVEQILAAAEEFKADVIVLGSHSKGVLEHGLLGSVAEKVLHKSRRPTLVIPLPKA
jgi:nucleotide-binding universal stress UspA family protein